MYNVFILWEESREEEENISENVCKHLRQITKSVFNLKTTLKLFYKNYDQGQPSKFQDSQDSSTEKPCLEKQRQQQQKFLLPP